MRLIWHNCRTFNTPGSDIVQLADALQKDFEARCGTAACAAAISLLLAEGKKPPVHSVLHLLAMVCHGLACTGHCHQCTLATLHRPTWLLQVAAGGPAPGPGRQLPCLPPEGGCLARRQRGPGSPQRRQQTG